MKPSHFLKNLLLHNFRLGLVTQTLLKLVSNDSTLGLQDLSSTLIDKFSFFFFISLMLLMFYSYVFMMFVHNMYK